MGEIEYRRKLKSQLVDAHGKIVYTYTAHHKMVDRFEWHIKCIKFTQIVLTAISSIGFIATVFWERLGLCWIGGIPAAISLGLNLYTKDFNLQENIQQHINAANALWDVREAYVSLITDFDILTLDEIRRKRDELQNEVSCINKKYPGTDIKSFKKARKALQEEEQTFKNGEAELFLHSEIRK